MSEIYVVEEYGTPTLAFKTEEEAREFVDERPGRVISQIPLQD